MIDLPEEATRVTRPVQIYNAMERLRNEVNRLRVLNEKISGTNSVQGEAKIVKKEPSLEMILNETSQDIYQLSDELSEITSSIEQKLF